LKVGKLDDDSFATVATPHDRRSRFHALQYDLATGKGQALVVLRRRGTRPRHQPVEMMVARGLEPRASELRGPARVGPR
jgi:hypothetical protein